MPSSGNSLSVKDNRPAGRECEHHAFAVILEQPDLDAFATKMAASSFVAWDTEFARGGGSYHPELCLIQCMTDKGECAVIDPIAGKLDLSSLLPVFENPDIVFLGHALRQDIEVALRYIGAPPKVMWDTQIAAFFCGADDYRGYAYLAEKLLNVRLNKKMQYSNWRKRPLSPGQLEYAAKDVCYLAEIYRIQRAKTESNGYSARVFDETRALLSDIERQYSGETAFKKLPLRDVSGLDPQICARLTALCEWRERRAMTLDLPRKKIFADDAIVKIASEGAAPEILALYAEDTDAEALDEIAALPPAPAGGVFPFSPQQMKPRPDARILSALSLILSACAEKAGLAPDFLCTKTELKALAAYPENTYSFDGGWRHGLFGKHARAFLNGEEGIFMENGAPRVRRL